MSANVTYNPGLNSYEKNQFQSNGWQLPFVNQNNTSEQYNQLALLSKRKAQEILKIGWLTLNKLIEEGEIKIIVINGKEKIPYVSLQDFIYNKSIKKVTLSEKYATPLEDEESIQRAYEIINEVKKGVK